MAFKGFRLPNNGVPEVAINEVCNPIIKIVSNTAYMNFLPILCPSLPLYYLKVELVAHAACRSPQINGHSIGFSVADGCFYAFSVGHRVSNTGKMVQLALICTLLPFVCQLFFSFYFLFS